MYKFSQLTKQEIKPGLRIIQTDHPEYGSWVVQQEAYGVPGTWEVRGKSGLIAVDESELIRFWEKTDKTASIKLASLQDIPNDFRSIGTGFYKNSHALWKLQPVENGKFALVRTAEEPIFNDNTSEEISDNTQKRTASKSFQDSSQISDRFGNTLNINDTISYSQDNEIKVGKIAQINQGFVTVNHTDIPAELTEKLSSNKIPDEQKDLYKSQAENDEANMVAPRPERPKKNAVDETAKKYWEKYWEAYGTSLCEEKLTKKYPEQKKVAYSWEDLSTIFGKEHIVEIKNSLASGVAYRLASKDWNLPFAVTKAVFKNLANFKPWEAKKVADYIKQALKNSNDISKISMAYGPDAYQAALTIQKMASEGITKLAIDQTAIDYYTNYYGNFGKALVQEIKRRVMADLEDSKK